VIGCAKHPSPTNPDRIDPLFGEDRLRTMADLDIDFLWVPHALGKARA
jgi:hypothetical protein